MKWDENLKNIFDRDLQLNQNETKFELKIKELEACENYITNNYHIFQNFQKNKIKINFLLDNIIYTDKNAIKPMEITYSIKEIDDLIIKYNKNFNISVTSFNECKVLLKKKDEKKILYNHYLKCLFNNEEFNMKEVNNLIN
jgi:hypothetical protein